MEGRDAVDIVQIAWNALPASHRRLLMEMGAPRWQIVDRHLGDEIQQLLISAGHTPPSQADREAQNGALGIWVRELRLVLINEAHEALVRADASTREALLAWVAWHEWGHALSIMSNTPHDPDEGRRLLELAPPGIRERVRQGGYGRREYIHELAAETYALLMRARVEGREGQPSWLPDEIYQLAITMGWDG